MARRFAMRKRNVAIAVGGAIGATVAVKMLARASTVSWDDVQHLIVHANRSRFVDVDGIRLHYQEFGEATAPAVILIHGYTASSYVWKTTAPQLADGGLRVIAIDLVGFGYSEKPRAFEYSIAAQARMVTRFMDRLGIGRACILGSSYGGAVAATIALDHAQCVDKLVLVDAVINDRLKSHPILRLASLPGVGEVITPFIADSRRFMRYRMRHTLGPSSKHLVTDERIDNVRRPLFAADGHHSLLATSRNWHANRIERDAHLISQPTLIVWGEHDTVIPLRDGHKLHNAIPDSRLVVIKDCGHVPQEERSDVFANVVAEFCREDAS
jgi:pimeloyl-ACP methyl ester carboxylesterase